MARFRPPRPIASPGPSPSREVDDLFDLVRRAAPFADLPRASFDGVLDMLSGRYPSVHGAPVQIGLPATLGIADLAAPDWGDFLPLAEGEVPVFWACGVTPQAVAMAARPPLMITHAPGHMFITDIPIDSLAVG